MIAVDVHGLLRVWEEQQRAHPVQRALHLLVHAWPEPGWDGWLHAPIGVRDGALLSLHERLFGSALHTTTKCPHCGERLESAFGVDDVRSGTPARPGAESPLSLHEQDYAIDYRLPTSDDLLQLAAPASGAVAEAAARELMQRCVSRACCDGVEIDIAALPEAVVATLGADMARHDPDADVRVALACPACGEASQMHFDIVSYLWSEFDDWAQRLIADVHVLARAYGWSEDAIFALSPVRRQLYLDMVAA